MLSADKNPHFIISNSDIGAGKRGASDGPIAVKDELTHLGYPMLEFDILENFNIQTQYLDNSFGKHIENLLEAMVILNDKVIDVISKNKFPIILSGDHSNAIGGLSGLKNANPDKTIGVIWIDAHADLHSPYTTPTGNIHGMPLAALAGIDNQELKKNEVAEDVIYYWNELKNIGIHNISPKFDLKNLVFIGVRDAEDQEWAIIEKAGIITFEPDDIRAKGIKKILTETLQCLSHCDLLYISFDADSLDPEISTGTGTTSPDGLNIEQAEIIFKTLMSNPKIGAFEITEVNPNLDTNDKAMAKVISNLLIKGLN
ncbi:MAG: arginase [Bacteroidetes bacterium]|nr:arginase [Bacteroidota bacterium]